MLSHFSGKQGRLPWQPNLGKNKPKLHWFQCCTTYREIFRANNSLLGSANSNMLSEFSGEQGKLPWQPNLGKNKPKLQLFQFCTRYRNTFCVYGRVLGSVNSNMLSEFSWEQGKLPWQPNLGKISRNCTYFSTVQDMEIFFRVNNRVTWVDEFKYAIWIFRGARAVAMATKFGQK